MDWITLETNYFKKKNVSRLELSIFTILNRGPNANWLRLKPLRMFKAPFHISRIAFKILGIVDTQCMLSLVTACRISCPQYALLWLAVSEFPVEGGAGRLRLQNYHIWEILRNWVALHLKQSGSDTSVCLYVSRPVFMFP